MEDFWAEMGAPPPAAVLLNGVELRKGSRVRLTPRPGRDILDLALAGRVAVVEALDQDHDGTIHLAVVLEDDPGRELGEARLPAHRFYFGLDEVEPLAGAGAEAPRRILVAGIGNVFLGDDGFGVEVARRLAERRPAPGVEVADFGIRGLDLAYALQGDYAAAILVDAMPRGGVPGTLYLVEPEPADAAGAEVVPHGMDPARVLRLARALGRVPERTLVVGCEPLAVPGGADEDDLAMGLSDPVRRAADEAVRLIESLIEELR